MQLVPLAAERRGRLLVPGCDREVASEKGQRKWRQRCWPFDVADSFDAKGIRSLRGFPPQRDRLKMWHHEEGIFLLLFCLSFVEIDRGKGIWAAETGRRGALESEAQELLLEDGPPQRGVWERASGRSGGRPDRIKDSLFGERVW